MTTIFYTVVYLNVSINMDVNKNTELRKLRPAEFHKFAMILSPSENWKKLVSLVTKEGTENIPKFDGETITIIEEASKHERKPAAAIFLQEWSSMGRKRPTFGLFLDLLMKAELFRAADYLAKDILKIETPPRPATGPAVQIDVEGSLAELLRQQDLNAQSVFEGSNRCLRATTEINLSQINYPMEMLDSEMSASDNNFAMDDNDVGVIEMQYDQPRSNQVLDHARTFQSTSDTENRRDKLCNELENSESLNELNNDVRVLKNSNGDTSKSCGEPQTSDLMKFSNATDETKRHQNFNGYSRSDLIKFDSAKIDNDENERCSMDMSDPHLPNFNILFAKSSTIHEQKSEINDKFIENRDSDDSNVNTNNAAMIYREMSSAELPAILKKFDVSEYCHRELTSAELPLCINDRNGFNSSETNSFREGSSHASSIHSDSNPLGSSVRSLEDEHENERKTSEQIDGRNKRIGVYEGQNEPFNSQELPVTVVEFHQR